MKRPTIGRFELTEITAQAARMPKLYTLAAINGFFEVVTERLGEGIRVQFNHRFTFTPKTRKERPARNPRTGEVVMLPKRRTVTCKFSKEIKCA